MSATTNAAPPLSLRRIAMLWAALITCAALSLGSSISMLPAIDRWNDCGRLVSELDLAAVGSPLLAAAAIGAWFWLRNVIPTARPELLGIATAAIIAILVLCAVPLQLLSTAAWTESLQSFRMACEISEWGAFLRGMPLHLPAVALVVLAVATPRSRPLSTGRAIIAAAIIVALWALYVLAAQPFQTFTPA